MSQRMATAMDGVTSGIVENRLATLEKREQQVRKAIGGIVVWMGMTDKTGPMAQRAMKDLEEFLAP